MNYKHKIVVEIDGVRHRMVNSRLGGNLCDKCSISNECGKIIDTPCFGVRSYFKKEKQQPLIVKSYGKLGK